MTPRLVLSVRIPTEELGLRSEDSLYRNGQRAGIITLAVPTGHLQNTVFRGEGGMGITDLALPRLKSSKTFGDRGSGGTSKNSKIVIPWAGRRAGITILTLSQPKPSKTIANPPRVGERDARELKCCRDRRARL